jgi:hypothetical protein
MMGSESWDVKYRIVEVEEQDKSSGPYYFIGLPEEISEMGLAIGDTAKLEFEDDEDPQYIEGHRTEKDGSTSEGYYKVWDYKGSTLTIPSKWDDLLKEPVNYVAVKIDRTTDPPQFRIYDVEDIYRRYDELTNQEGVVIGEPLLTEIVVDPTIQDTEVVDLASKTPFPGQRFRIVPVNPDYEPLVKHARKKENKERVCINSDHVATVTQDQEIPSKQADELAITWEFGVSTVEDVEELQTRTTYNQAKLIYRDTFTEETTIKLPKFGRFRIWELSAGWKGFNWVTYMNKELMENGVPYGNRVTSEWGANFFDASESDDSCITLYLPIPFIKKGTPDVWWA